MTTMQLDDVTASGESVIAFVQGLGRYKAAALEILTKHTIDDPKAGQWYPMTKVLAAYRELEAKLGTAALFIIGERILETAVFPPEMDSIEKGLASIDVAYHMNHMKGSQVMFDPQTGQKLSGIGNYQFNLLNANEAEMICDNPYPTAFDEGIIFAIAQRFNKASVVHWVEEKSSRSENGGQDVYLVQWF